MHDGLCWKIVFDQLAQAKAFVGRQVCFDGRDVTVTGMSAFKDLRRLDHKAVAQSRYNWGGLLHDKGGAPKPPRLDPQ